MEQSGLGVMLTVHLF